MILTFGTTPALARSMTFTSLRVGDVNRTAEVRVAAAGKATNAARVIATLGEPVVCAGVTGGCTGAELVADMRAAGIEPLMQDVEAATRVCVTVIDTAAAATTELIQDAAPLRPHDVEALLDRCAPRLAHCSAVLCLGSLAPGVPADIYARVVGLARQANPNVIAIIDAHGKALLEALAVGGVIVKCNAHELRATFDAPDESVSTILRTLLDCGAAGAVITDGTRPTTVCDLSGVHAIDTPRVNVVSPIGSGDSVAAGLAVGLTRGMAFADAARLGVACGAANAMTAVAGMVDPAEVERLFEKVVAIRT